MVIYRHNAVRCRRHADRREEVPHRLADKEVGLTIGSLLGGGKTSSPRLCGRRVPTRLTRGCHRPFDFRVIRGTGGGFDLGANPRQVRVGASLALRTRSWPRPSADRTSHICRSTSFEAPPILASRRALRWKARFREAPSPLGGARARCATPTAATRPSAHPAALEGSIYCGVA
jgi:hypothetical protein